MVKEEKESGEFQPNKEELAKFVKLAMSGGYVFPDDAATYLGVSEEALECWRRAGYVPSHIEIDCEIMYALQGLYAYVDAAKHGTLKLV